MNFLTFYKWGNWKTRGKLVFIQLKFGNWQHLEIGFVIIILLNKQEGDLNVDIMTQGLDISTPLKCIHYAFLVLSQKCKVGLID